MARGNCTFRKRDLTAAIKAAREASREAQVVVDIYPDGRMRIFVGTDEQVDQLDAELKQFEARHGQD